MKTHYDVLNLGRSCTSKEIKDSFIKLSKIYHPDINKSSDAHKKFVEVNEAYSVLGKQETRLKYDCSLSSGRAKTEFGNGPSSTMRTYEDYAYIYSRNLKRSQESSRGHINNRKLYTFFFCCLLMMIGSGFRLRFELKKKERHNKEIAKFLKELKEQKKLNKEYKVKGVEV